MASTLDRRALTTADWSHQPRLIDAAISVLTHSPRTRLIAACGTGKTKMGSCVVKSFMEDDFTFLLVVPTIDLLAQTLTEYAEVAGEVLGSFTAVCSDAKSAAHAQNELGREHTRARVTTDPGALAQWLESPGRHTVAVTYQSLGVLERAHARHGLRPWKMAVIDEAHRTAGVHGKPWSAILYDAQIPCCRRLFLTATPRYFNNDEGTDVVSMDDEALYGPVADTFGFAEAIAAGVLVDYQLVVPVITDEHLRTMAMDDSGQAPFWSPSGGVAVSPQILAAQLAVLRAAHEGGARRIVTFHNTIAAARTFAATLPHAAELLAPEQRPEALHARYISGTHKGEQRREVFAELASDRPGLVVICNAKVLAEGVNVPAIDGVAFIDPRNSFEGTIQAIGRAIRSSGRRDKIASIIVPVLLSAEETPEGALAGSAYRQVWQSIRALEAHDERVETWIREQMTHWDRDTDGTPYLFESPAQSRTDYQLPPWLKISGVPVPPGFAESILLRIFRPSSGGTHPLWEANFEKARAFSLEYGHLLPEPAEQPELAYWLTSQRSAYKAKLLAAESFRRLSEIGMVWDLASHWWRETMDALQSLKKETGSLRGPVTRTFGNPPRQLRAGLETVSRWYAQGKLTPEQTKEADELGINPDGAKKAFWLNGEKCLREYCEKYGNLNIPGTLTWGEDKFPLGQWRYTQIRAVREGTMPEEYKERLADLLELLMSSGNENIVDPGIGFRAVEAYAAEYGHLSPDPNTHIRVDGVIVKLNAWLNHLRTQYESGTLPEGWFERLTALGMPWTDQARKWWGNLRTLQAHIAEHGPVPANSDVPLRRGLKASIWIEATWNSIDGGALTIAQLKAFNSLEITYDAA